MAGWIKIHREIQKHWIAQHPEKLGRWVDLLLLANFEDSKVLVGDRLIAVKRGQMIMSFDFLAKRWNISKSTASKFIELLESDKMVERHTEQRKTILTICNYESYQQKNDTLPNETPNNFRTTSEQLPNAFKEEKEDKEINNNKSNARTREERVSWDEVKERGFREAFKCGGQIMALARNCKLSASEINEYLERYMNERQVFDMGHQDISHFGRGFKRYIEEEMKKPKPIEQPKSRVIEGKEIFSLYK